MLHRSLRPVMGHRMVLSKGNKRGQSLHDAHLSLDNSLGRQQGYCYQLLKYHTNNGSPSSSHPNGGSSISTEEKIPRIRIKGSTSSHIVDPIPYHNSAVHHTANGTMKLGDDKSKAHVASAKAMFATKVGAAANLGLAISKGALGFAIASTGLIADAANSMGDLLSDAVVYYSITEARKEATPDRPWGEKMPCIDLHFEGSHGFRFLLVIYLAVN